MLVGSRALNAPRTPMPNQDTIDAHVHVWSADTARFPFAPGYGPGDLWFPSFDGAELVARGEPAGVGRFNLVQMTWYGLDHSYIADLIQRDPRRFAGTGIVPAISDVGLPEPDGAMQALAEQGIRAFRVRGQSTRPDVPGGEQWLDHPAYEAMFRMSAADHLPLSFLCGATDLPEIDRMCARHGDAPVILDHLARLGPATGATAEDVDALCALARHPRTMVKLSAFGALSQDGPPYLDMLPLVRRVLDAYGPERCMWASDSPLQTAPPHSYETSVGLLAEHADFLSAGDLAQLLHGTAERVFWPG